MALVKISEEEELVYDYDHDTSFVYRRIKQSEISNINKRNTSRGIPDAEKAGLQMLKTALKGWTGYIDAEGKDVPFNSEEIAALPTEVQVDLIRLISSASGTEKKSV